MIKEIGRELKDYGHKLSVLLEKDGHKFEVIFQRYGSESSKFFVDQTLLEMGVTLKPLG